MGEPPEEEPVLGEEEEVPEESPPAKCKKNLKVLVTNQRIPTEALDLLRESCEVHFLPPPGDEKMFMRYCQCMDGILLDNPSLSLDREFFRGAGLGLKAVSVVGWHGGQVDCREAEKKKIKIGVCPTELSVDSTAEVAVGMALLLCRRLKEGNNNLISGTADLRRPDYLLGVDIKNCICGIVGLGKLGVSIAVRLQAFWPKRIIYYSRRTKKAGEKLSIDRILLNELIEISDLIFLSLPCNSTTKGMFNQELLVKMKRCCFLINPSHGGLININDLYCALRKGLICGAAMDAELSDAPFLKHPIYRLDNFFFLPNVGRSSALVKLRMYITAVQNIINALVLRKMLFPYPPEPNEEFVETDEERIVREAEEERLRLVLEEQLRLEMEERLRLEEEERMRLLEELEGLEEEEIDEDNVITYAAAEEEEH